MLWNCKHVKHATRRRGVPIDFQNADLQTFYNFQQMTSGPFYRFLPPLLPTLTKCLKSGDGLSELGLKRLACLALGLENKSEIFFSFFKAFICSKLCRWQSNNSFWSLIRKFQIWTKILRYIFLTNFTDYI